MANVNVIPDGVHHAAMSDATGPSRLREWAARHEVGGLELFDLASEWEADQGRIGELEVELAEAQKPRTNFVFVKGNLRLVD